MIRTSTDFEHNLNDIRKRKQDAEEEENYEKLHKYIDEAILADNPLALSLFEEAVPTKIPWLCQNCGCTDEFNMNGERICLCDVCKKGCETTNSRRARGAKRSKEFQDTEMTMEAFFDEFDRLSIYEFGDDITEYKQTIAILRGLLETTEMVKEAELIRQSVIELCNEILEETDTQKMKGRAWVAASLFMKGMQYIQTGVWQAILHADGGKFYNSL